MVVLFKLFNKEVISLYIIITNYKIFHLYYDEMPEKKKKKQCTIIIIIGYLICHSMMKWIFDMKLLKH